MHFYAEIEIWKFYYWKKIFRKFYCSLVKKSRREMKILLINWSERKYLKAFHDCKHRKRSFLFFLAKKADVIETSAFRLPSRYFYFFQITTFLHRQEKNEIIFFFIERVLSFMLLLFFPPFNHFHHHHLLHLHLHIAAIRIYKKNFLTTTTCKLWKMIDSRIFIFFLFIHESWRWDEEKKVKKRVEKDSEKFSLKAFELI